MSTDRSAALRRAEKWLRTGQLDRAIGEYQQVIEAASHAGDATEARIALAQLCVRAGREDDAAQHFHAAADERFDAAEVEDAAELYRRVLAIRSTDERALLRLADIAALLDQVEDACARFEVVIANRLGRGDRRGAAELQIRVSELAPQDRNARRTAADARELLGDVDGAVRDRKTLADWLLADGRHREAADVLRDAVRLLPDDREVRSLIFECYLAAGDLTQALEHATEGDQWHRVGAALQRAGRDDDAIDALREGMERHPEHEGVRASLALYFVERGDAVNAASYLQTDVDTDDPQIAFAFAEIALRGGRAVEAVPLLRRLASQDAALAEPIARLGCQLARRDATLGFEIVESAVEQWVGASAWTAAASALDAFLTCVPSSTTALVRLIEVAVDGDLTDVASASQARLADAYLAAGEAAEALAVAQDLAEREPWEPAHAERVKQALALKESREPALALSGDAPRRQRRGA